MMFQEKINLILHKIKSFSIHQVGKLGIEQ